MDEVEYYKKVGVYPTQDDLERVNCVNAGLLGHSDCGWCDVCDKPRFMCNDKGDRKVDNMNRDSAVVMLLDNNMDFLVTIFEKVNTRDEFITIGTILVKGASADDLKIVWSAFRAFRNK